VCPNNYKWFTSVKRTHNHCSSIRQIFHHKLQRRLAAHLKGLMIKLENWPNPMSKSTRTSIDMRYIDAFPDFRFLEETIDLVCIKLVSYICIYTLEFLDLWFAQIHHNQRFMWNFPATYDYLQWGQQSGWIFLIYVFLSLIWVILLPTITILKYLDLTFLSPTLK